MILPLCLALAVTGCGKNKDGDVPEAVQPEAEVTETKPETRAEKPSNEQPAGVTVDITSEDAVFGFLAGDWLLQDTVGGKDIGRLTISSTGGLVYERLSDGLKCEGNMFLSRYADLIGDGDRDSDKNGLTSYEFSFYNIPDGFYIPETSYQNPEKETAGGNFYIGSGDGEDYLYLTFIGNGDSFIFYEMFQDADRIMDEMKESDNYYVQADWVLHRDNGGADTSVLPAAGEFYAWAWKQADNTLLLQPMESHTYEAYEDYTFRHYTAGYFEEKDNITLGEYHLTDDTDMNMVLYKDNVRTEYPLRMYKVDADMSGNIRSLEELSFSYYGIYDMGDLKPEFDYDPSGLTFTYNDVEYDLADYDTVSNAIMDMYQVGEWIVIETHVNPHVGQYYMLNTYTGNIERVIVGAGLTWRGDDITTAVYSEYDTIYNYKGHIIGKTDGGNEVYDLSFGEDGPLVVAEDFSGRKYNLDEATGDEAMYRYATYLRHPNASTWNDFMAYAPDDAIAFIIENPPVDVNYCLSHIYQVDDTSDQIYVAALNEYTGVAVDSGEADYDSNGNLKWTSKALIDNETIRLGDYLGYGVTIPEGVPNKCIHVSVKDKGGMYPITPVTGQADISSTFVRATMSADEAMKDALNASGTYSASETYDDEFAAYDAILRKYRTAQNEAYSEEQVLEMGLDTELIQRAWPWAASGEAVKFLVYDLDEDETPELIITYYDSIIDIYGFHTDRAVHAYSCMYRSQAELYRGGYLLNLFSGTAADGTVTWYKYNAALADFVPVYKSSYLLNDSGKGVTRYYAYNPLGEEVEISEEEFKSSIPAESDRLTLPEGTLLSEFNGLG